MNSWIFDELNRREFMKKTALTGAAAYLGIGSDYGIAAVEPPHRDHDSASFSS